MSPASPNRLPWIDHLRTAMIVLVVNMHACVTYSHVGDWYIKIQPEPTLGQKVPFIVWQGMLQSFFMGLMFFAAAYFAAGSLARRGPGGFARERLFRLGLPALLYMLVIHPFIVLGLNPWGADFGSKAAWYWRHVSTGRFVGESGPLWFAVVLLIFSLVLAGWRASRPKPAAATPVAAPEGKTLLGFAFVVGLATFAVRLVQPIETDVLNIQLCFCSQYVAWFVAGLHAARHGWLESFAASPGARRAGGMALLGGPVALLALFVAGARDVPLQVFFGGWHWQAFALSLWEQFTGLGLAAGALALFSRRSATDSAAWRWLSERSFGVYVLHTPVLIALTMLYRPLPYQLYGLVMLLTVTGLVASYALADLARRIPGLRAIL